MALVAAQATPMQAGGPARLKPFEGKPLGPPGPNRPSVLSSWQLSPKELSEPQRDVTEG
jgi:hypothetical protein